MLPRMGNAFVHDLAANALLAANVLLINAGAQLRTVAEREITTKMRLDCRSRTARRCHGTNSWRCRRDIASSFMSRRIKRSASLPEWGRRSARSGAGRRQCRGMDAHMSSDFLDQERLCRRPGSAEASAKPGKILGQPSDEMMTINFVVPSKREPAPMPLDVTPPAYPADAQPDYTRPALEPPRPRQQTPTGAIWEAPPKPTDWLR